MALSDLAKWEAKHAVRMAQSPSSKLEWLTPPASSSLALDLACGQGRNAHALAALGYSVVAADISRQGLRWVQAATSGKTRPPLPVQCDLDDWCFSPSCFDLAVQCDFLDRSLFPVIMNSLRPGGLVLVDTFAAAGDATLRCGPTNPAYRLRAGELREIFVGWNIISCEENDRAAILAQKPARL